MPGSPDSTTRARRHDPKRIVTGEFIGRPTEGSAVNTSAKPYGRSSNPSRSSGPENVKRILETRRWPGVEHLPIEGGDLVRDAHQTPDVVADNDDRNPPVVTETQEQLLEEMHAGHVDVARRLVEQKQFRFRIQRLGEKNAPKLTPREAPHQTVHDIGGSGPLEKAPGFATEPREKRG